MKGLSTELLNNIDKVNRELIKLAYKKLPFTVFANEMCDFLNRKEDYHIGMFDYTEQINHHFKTIDEIKIYLEFVKNQDEDEYEEGCLRWFVLDNEYEHLQFMNSDEFVKYVKNMDYTDEEAELNMFLWKILLP